MRITEANSFVEQRRADVIRARQRLRKVSDQLKRLMNAPGLEVAGETLVLPSDEPIDAPVRFSLRDAVAKALRYRPELQQALLAIRDASTRQQVADNQRLPLLNVGAAVVFNGLGLDGVDDAYDQLDDFNFIDYVLRTTSNIRSAIGRPRRSTVSVAWNGVRQCSNIVAAPSRRCSI